MKWLIKGLLVFSLLALYSSTNSEVSQNLNLESADILEFPVLDTCSFTESEQKLRSINKSVRQGKKELEEVRILLEEKKVRDSLLIEYYSSLE